MWTSEDPKHLMSDLVHRVIRAKVNRHGSEWNRHSQYESRWEKAECDIIGEYCLQGLVFLKGELMLVDLYAVGLLTNVFFDMLLPFEAGSVPGDRTYRVEQRREILQQALKELFNQKRITREEVKKVLEFA